MGGGKGLYSFICEKVKVERLGVVTGQSWHGKAAGHGYRSHMFGAVALNKLFKHTFEQKKKMFTVHKEEYEKKC